MILNKEEEQEKQQEKNTHTCICCHESFIPMSFDQDMCRKCLISYSDFLSPKGKKIIII